MNEVRMSVLEATFLRDVLCEAVHSSLGEEADEALELLETLIENANYEEVGEITLSNT